MNVWSTAITDTTVAEVKNWTGKNQTQKKPKQQKTHHENKKTQKGTQNFIYLGTRFSAAVFISLLDPSTVLSIERPLITPIIGKS